MFTSVAVVRTKDLVPFLVSKNTVNFAGPGVSTVPISNLNCFSLSAIIPPQSGITHASIANSSSNLLLIKVISSLPFPVLLNISDGVGLFILPLPEPIESVSPILVNLPCGISIESLTPSKKKA